MLQSGADPRSSEASSPSERRASTAPATRHGAPLSAQVALAALYVITGGAGLALAIEPGNVTAVWPPSGLAIAAILLRGPSLGRGVFAGAMLVNALFYAHAGASALEVALASALIGAGSATQALLAASLVERYAGGKDALLTPRRAGTLFALTFAACAIGATVGVSALLAFGRIAPGSYASTWVTWWLGDLVGAILVVPLALATVGRLSFPARAPERALHAVLLLATVELIFAPLGIGPGIDAPYLLLPPFVTIAYRLGPRDASIAAIAAYLGAALGIAGSRHESAPAALLTIDAVLFSLFLPALVLASAEWDRRAKERELRGMHEDLERRVAERTTELERSNRELADQITERARTEARLRESEARLHTAIESLPFDFWLLDEHGRYVLLNSTAKRRWGDRTGLRPDDLDLPEDVVRHWRENNARALAGEIVTRPVEYEREGEKRSYDGILAPVRVDGRIVGALGVNIDVTERVRLADNLLRAQKMESVGRLAGGIAHDFNNLLTIISGATELLVRRTAAGSLEHELAGQALDAASQAAELTRRLLLFAGARPGEDRVASLEAHLTTALSLLRPLLPANIQVHVEQRATRRVRLDPTRLGQVVVNLAINARDAMPSGGSFTLRTYDAGEESVPRDGWIESPPEPGPHVVLEISDTGAGMSEEVQRLAFEPFFTTKGPRRGTGLGLASVRGIVRQAGGAIHLSSVPGQGTTFRIHLPEASADASSPGTPVRPSVRRADAPPSTILLVEDEDGVRRTIARMLEGAGHRTLVAGDAAEARALVVREPIDLLVSDVVMPGASGPELARELRALRPGLPVLFLSAHAGDAIDELGGPLLSKPCRADELIRAVSEQLIARPAA